MLEFSYMSMLLTAILLICGYLALAQAVNSISDRSYYSLGNTLLIDIVVAVLYLLVCAAIGLLYIYSGYDSVVICGALGLGVLVVLILFFRFCIKNWSTMQKGHMVVFIIYFAVVLYLTVFMRIGGTGDNSIVTTPFDDLMDAIQYRNPELVSHMVYNILMFIPFGYLIPAMNPEKLRKVSFAFLGGIMSSTVIEGVQLVFSLGQSDIDDIIANSMGAVLGYLAVRFVWQFQKNWRL